MELNELKVKNGYVITFASGYKLNETASTLTITAPQGMQVSLQRMAARGGSIGHYTVTVDGTDVITNQPLEIGNEEGLFLINAGHDSAGAVPALTGNSITINHVSGNLNYNYGYLFIESK